VDDWFAAWIIADEQARQMALAKIVTPDIQVRDRFSLLNGIDDLTSHIAASQRFMTGFRWERKGDIRHCQGTALADWIAIGPDGQPRMNGTNVFIFGPDVRIQSVTGIANAG
jgi:hypothetical protein